MNTWQIVVLIVAAWLIIATVVALVMGRMVRRAESEEVTGDHLGAVVKEPSPDVTSAASPLWLQP